VCSSDLNGDYSGVGTHYFRFAADGFVIALLSNQADLPRTELFQKIAAIVNGGEPSGPRPRLADEIYDTIISEGEDAGLKFMKTATTEGRRGAPVAMQAIQIGNTLSRMGRSEAARRVYAYAALADPQAPWGHLGLGQWYEDNEQDAKAEACYLRVLNEDPEQPHALEYLAELQSKNK